MDKDGIDGERVIDVIGAKIHSGHKLQLSRQYIVDMMTGINKDKYFLKQEVVKREIGENLSVQEINMLAELPLNLDGNKIKILDSWDF